MTSFDLLIVFVLVLSTALSVMRGGMREVGTILVLVLAAGLALLLAKPLAGVFGASKSFLAMSAIAGLTGFAAFCGLYVLLFRALQRVPLNADRRRVDRIGGGVFGFVRGLALLGLGFLAYGYYLDPVDHPRAVTGALFLPVARVSAEFFSGFAPEENRLDPLGAAKPQTDAAQGYERNDRSALAEMVTTVTTTDAPANAADPIAAVLEERKPE